MDAGRLSEGFWEHSINIRILSLNAKAYFVLQTTFVLLTILFYFKYISFQIGLASEFIDLKTNLYHENKCV